MKFEEVKNFVNGSFKPGSSDKTHAVISPLRRRNIIYIQRVYNGRLE
jgi:hypothetical protein